MSKIYPSMPHLEGNLLCAVDLECTGLRAGYHEPIQIAIVPLDAEIRPYSGLRPFYMNMAPQCPSRAESGAGRTHGLDLHELMMHALSADKVADLLVEWFEALELPVNRGLVPLAHNWSYESSFLRAWLGEELVSRMFHAHARDAMILALSINDRRYWSGEKPLFKTVSLKSLCTHFGVVNERPHDALSDCIAEAEVYRNLIHLDLL